MAKFNERIVKLANTGKMNEVPLKFCIGICTDFFLKNVIISFTIFSWNLTFLHKNDMWQFYAPKFALSFCETAINAKFYEKNENFRIFFSANGMPKHEKILRNFFMFWRKVFTNPSRRKSFFLIDINKFDLKIKLTLEQSSLLLCYTCK